MTRESELSGLLNRAIAAADGGTAVPAPRSHFVLVLKPEVLSTARLDRVVEIVIRVLAESGVELRRAAVYRSVDYLDRGWLWAHYPRLHRIGHDGAAALDPQASATLAGVLEGGPAASVVSAFQMLRLDPGITPQNLDAACRRHGIAKLAPGSYVSRIPTPAGDRMVLNGFLPALIDAYRSPQGMVAVVECVSSDEIGDVRTRVLGPLDPGTAAPTTLRGALGAACPELGLPPLTPGSNGVHVSPGLVEGMFHAWRHFLAGHGYGLETTMLGAHLAAGGVPLDRLALLETDPVITLGDGRTDSVDGATEGLDLDTVTAILIAAMDGEHAVT